LIIDNFNGIDPKKKKQKKALPATGSKDIRLFFEKPGWSWKEKI